MVYFPPSTADVTNIRLAHWTMAEFVLLNEQNFSVVDAIYSRLSMDSLLSLSVTCFKARLSWIAYKERMFNIIKLLAKFFNDADGFRELQRRTNVVIIGDVPLLYLLRSPVDRAIFDVAVNPTHANSVVHYLMCMEGYMVWTGGQWGHDITAPTANWNALWRATIPRPAPSVASPHLRIWTAACLNIRISHAMKVTSNIWRSKILYVVTNASSGYGWL